MPKKITAYKCKYSCGHSPYNNQTDAIEHEKICYRNPAQRACIICWYFQFESEEERKVCVKKDFYKNFKPNKMYKEKGICYNCKGFDQNGPE